MALTVLMMASWPLKAATKADSVYSALWTRTLGGKVELLDSRVRIETLKAEELTRAWRMGFPTFPPA